MCPIMCTVENRPWFPMLCLHYACASSPRPLFCKLCCELLRYANFLQIHWPVEDMEWVPSAACGCHCCDSVSERRQLVRFSGCVNDKANTPFVNEKASYKFMDTCACVSHTTFGSFPEWWVMMIFKHSQHHPGSQWSGGYLPPTKRKKHPHMWDKLVLVPTVALLFCGCMTCTIFSGLSLFQDDHIYEILLIDLLWWYLSQRKERRLEAFGIENDFSVLLHRLQHLGIETTIVSTIVSPSVSTVISTIAVCMRCFVRFCKILEQLACHLQFQPNNRWNHPEACIRLVP